MDNNKNILANIALENLLNNNKCIQSLFINMSSICTSNYNDILNNNDDKEISDIVDNFVTTIYNNNSSYQISKSFDILFRSLPKYKYYVNDLNIKAKVELYRMIFCQDLINFDLFDNMHNKDLLCNINMNLYYIMSACRNEIYTNDDSILWEKFYDVLSSLNILLDTIYLDKDAKEMYNKYYNNIIHLFATANKVKNKGYQKVSDDTKDLSKVLLYIYNNYHNYCK